MNSFNSPNTLTLRKTFHVIEVELFIQVQMCNRMEA